MLAQSPSRLLSKCVRKLGKLGVTILFVTVVVVSSGINASSSSSANSKAPAYFVATNGNDSNPGTLTQPFATLGQAQLAMQGSSIKMTYVRAGTYLPAAVSSSGCMAGDGSGSSIELSYRDNGETWSYYPSDGYNTAILNGQSTQGNSGGQGGNGTGCGFSGYNVADIKIIGIQFENYRYSAFQIDIGTGIIFTDNIVHDIKSASWGAGAVSMVCSPGAVVTNNYMYNLAYSGPYLLGRSDCPGAITNDLVSGNVIENSCTWPSVAGFGNDQNGGDCGAIYFDDEETPKSTNIQVVNNYLRDENLASSGQGDNGVNGRNGCCAIGVYLDDETSNVSITGNVIGGTQSACVQMNDANDNVITGNICDMTSTTYQSIVVYTPGHRHYEMTGNVFTNNIVISASTGASQGYYASGPAPNPMTIANNAYYNFVGTTITTTGGPAGSDSNPVYENPSCSGWKYKLASNSPVFDSPVSFPAIVGGWGPPWFTLPTTGTPPSCPH
jgi:hypothetical protein